MKTSSLLSQSARQVAARILGATSTASRDPLPLDAFCASTSPIRASIEITDPPCWVVETVDGERYGFTQEQVVTRFGSVWAFHAELVRRAVVTALAGKRNKARDDRSE